MADTTPWRCIGCRQLRKHSASHCHVCQQPWQVAMDRTYVHQQGGQKSQETYAQGWNYNQNWEGQQNWTRERSQSRTHTPKKGRKPKGAKTPRNNAQGDGKGAPMMPFPAAPGFGKGQPLPPPPMPWPGYAGMNQPMIMQPPMQPMPEPIPQHQPPPQMAQMMAPVAPTFSAPTPPQALMSSEQMEFIEMARAPQSELPADVRHQMQKMSKKEGARATKDLHSAVKQLGIARAEVEEAIQARINLIASWKNFLTEAVKTWQDYTVLFQTQERVLQARIQEAQENFALAKIQAAESQAVAGKLTNEIKDEDDDFVEGQETTDLSARSTKALLRCLRPCNRWKSRQMQSWWRRMRRSGSARRILFKEIKPWRSAIQQTPRHLPSRLLPRPAVHDVLVWQLRALPPLEHWNSRIHHEVAQQGFTQRRIWLWMEVQSQYWPSSSATTSRLWSVVRIPGSSMADWHRAPSEWFQPSASTRFSSDLSNQEARTKETRHWLTHLGSSYSEIGGPTWTTRDCTKTTKRTPSFLPEFLEAAFFESFIAILVIWWVAHVSQCQDLRALSTFCPESQKRTQARQVETSATSLWPVASRGTGIGNSAWAQESCGSNKYVSHQATDIANDPGLRGPHLQHSSAGLGNLDSLFPGDGGWPAHWCHPSAKSLDWQFEVLPSDLTSFGHWWHPIPGWARDGLSTCTSSQSHRSRSYWCIFVRKTSCHVCAEDLQPTTQTVCTWTRKPAAQGRQTPTDLEAERTPTPLLCIS